MQVSDGFNAVEVEFTVRLQDVDDTGPTVSKIEISSDPGSDRTYAAEDEIRVTVTFSETVEVTGTPRLQTRAGRGEYERRPTRGGTGTAALGVSNTRWPAGKATPTGWGSRANRPNVERRDHPGRGAERRGA